jgi:lipoprotein-anchoring transpeptidase ErfK/SrfK
VVSEFAMKNLVLRSAFSFGVIVAGEAHAQAIFNTPDGPVMIRPHLGRSQPARAPIPDFIAASAPVAVSAPVVVPVAVPAPVPVPAAVAVPVAMAAPPPIPLPAAVAIVAAPMATGPAARPVRAAAASRASAEPTPAEPGQFGGGFIEMLMTGRDPGPGVRPMPGYPAQRLAALHNAPEAQQGYGIRRVVPPEFHRQVVEYEGRQAPGTIVIDTPNKFLYLVQEGRKAIRYGIGVGRPGFSWAGMKTVSMKREWPDWRPPAEMLKRRPDLPHFMAGGPANPLGARALYLGSSLYRIHGTNEPWTIGEAVSSGCIRMMNDDVVDLYDRARVGTKVLVI